MGISDGASDFSVPGMDTRNGKHEMFGEPTCMLFYLYNIFHHIKERFCLIRGSVGMIDPATLKLRKSLSELFYLLFLDSYYLHFASTGTTDSS